MTPWAVRLVLAVALVTITQVPGPNPGQSVAASDDCVGLTCGIDVAATANSAYLGTGGLIIPGDDDDRSMSRADAAACADCEWRIASVCANASDPSIPCAGALVGCPRGQFRQLLFYRTAGQAAWTHVGDVCVGGGVRPVPVSEVGQAVRDRFVDRLPRPRPTYQPGNGALVNLPAVFDCGQAEGVLRDDFDLLGFPVEVAARPAWSWEFGDGGSLRTSSSGGRYPDVSVAHTYRRPGEFTVAVDTSWSGTFTVDGLGPFPVSGGPVTQRATLDVEVREAGARLVAD